MSKGVKIFLVILLILAIVGVALYFWSKSVWDKISFSKPRIIGINLNGLTAADLADIALTGSEKQVSATIAIDIKNDSNTKIPFQVSKIKVLYNGTQIGETSASLSQQNFILPANRSISVSDTITISLNAAGIQYAIAQIKNQNPELDFSLSFSLWGIPIPFKSFKL